MINLLDHIPSVQPAPDPFPDAQRSIEHFMTAMLPYASLTPCAYKVIHYFPSSEDPVMKRGYEVPLAGCYGELVDVVILRIIFKSKSSSNTCWIEYVIAADAPIHEYVGYFDIPSYVASTIHPDVDSLVAAEGKIFADWLKKLADCWACMVALRSAKR